MANAILAGRLAPDVWVAAPGGPRWLRALDVPVIGQLVEGIPTLPRRDSGLRLIPGTFPTTDAGMPAFGSTMMMVKDDELEPPAVEAPAIASSSAAPTTTRNPPALSIHEVDTRELPMRAAKPVAPPREEEDPPTDRALPPPPPSTTPSLPPTGVRVDFEKETAELPSSDRRRSCRGA